MIASGVMEWHGMACSQGVFSIDHKNLPGSNAGSSQVAWNGMEWHAVEFAAPGHTTQKVSALSADVSILLIMTLTHLV